MKQKISVNDIENTKYIFSELERLENKITRQDKDLWEYIVALEKEIKKLRREVLLKK